jgi:hypothetical protein
MGIEKVEAKLRERQMKANNITVTKPKTEQDRLMESARELDKLSKSIGLESSLEQELNELWEDTMRKI